MRKARASGQIVTKAGRLGEHEEFHNCLDPKGIEHGPSGEYHVLTRVRGLAKTIRYVCHVDPFLLFI